jgi:hypothetical protein
MIQGTVRVARRVLAIAGIAISMWVAGTGVAVAQQPDAAPGGFIDPATGNGLRQRLSAGQIQTFLPERGAFTFPAPYATIGVRLTNGSDCNGGDCVRPVGYSYWSNINNHAGSDTLLVMIGLARNAGGAGPSLIEFNKRTGATRNLGPIFSPDSPYSWGNGEGWYFSATAPNMLYLMDGARMMRYDVATRQLTTVFDVRAQTGSNDRILWQMHSSNDDRVHSATVRSSSSYEMLGCIAYREDTGRALYVAKRGDFDECQIDKSGRWLVIKENVDGRNGEDNRIIDMDTGAESVFLDENGAAGHSDLGYGYLVAEDNFNALPGAVRVWQFGQPMNAPGQGTVVYGLSSWSVGLGHLAHGNARSGSIESQMVCSSNASREQVSRVNEIVCYRLDGSMNALVVAPNLTSLDAAGGGDDYSKLPKGNLDVTGEYFVWTANAGSGRLDAFLVRIPQQKLGVAPAATLPSNGTPVSSTGPTTPGTGPTTPGTEPGTTAGTPTVSTPGAGTPTVTSGTLAWMSLINLAEAHGGLVKTGGCDGCPDALGVSQPVGDTATLQFAARDTRGLRFLGFGAGSVATGAGDIDFAIRLQGGTAEVRESGSYRTEVSLGAGDTFAIAVAGGRVRYLKNGTVFYESTRTAPAGLRVHAVFHELQAALGDITLGSAAASEAPPASTAQPGLPASAIEEVVRSWRATPAQPGR